MESLTYHLEIFDGPLDLLLSLIQKNKVDISDIPIADICDQYMDYLRAAERMDMELASEFIVMASELMYIKSRMLLPKAEPDEEDPRAALADTLIRYQQAKAAAQYLGKAYERFSSRLVKETDEISVDRSYVADQNPEALYRAVRRILSRRDERPVTDEKAVFRPMLSTPIVPVEAKMAGIARHFPADRPISLETLIDDSVSLPDMIAIFLGVLELIRMHRLILVEENEEEMPNAVLGMDASFIWSNASVSAGTDTAGSDAAESPHLSPDSGLPPGDSPFAEAKPETDDKEVTAHAE